MARKRVGNDRVVDVDGEVMFETEKAYRFRSGERTVWLPKSQCEWDADAKQMTMSEWLATDKELV